MQNIRDMQKFVSAICDWGPLNDCFQGKVRISDIDGIVERNGFFVFLEQKGAQMQIPVGQDILLSRLAQIPQFTVLIIFGNLDQEHGLEIRRGGKKWQFRSDLDVLKRCLASWDKGALAKDFTSFDSRLAKSVAPK
jgi:hypothetical protein